EYRVSRDGVFNTTRGLASRLRTELTELTELGKTRRIVPSLRSFISQSGRFSVLYDTLFPEPWNHRRRRVIRGCRSSVVIAAGSFCGGSDRGGTPGRLGEVRRVKQVQELPGIVRHALARGRTLLGQHRLFATAAAVAALPRVLAMLGYEPALLVRLDSYDYLWGAARLSPNLINVSGYSVFLWL